MKKADNQNNNATQKTNETLQTIGKESLYAYGCTKQQREREKRERREEKRREEKRKEEKRREEKRR